MGVSGMAGIAPNPRSHTPVFPECSTEPTTKETVGTHRWCVLNRRSVDHPSAGHARRERAARRQTLWIGDRLSLLMPGHWTPIWPP